MVNRAWGGGIAAVLSAHVAWAAPLHERWQDRPATREMPAVRTLRPAKPRDDHGWVLLLHGWGQHARDWEGLPDIQALSDAGWTLVAPDMGRSVYARQARGGTEDEPGHARIVAVVDWAVSSLGLAASSGARAVVGVSTGGRGAAILGAEGRFGTIVALSGTYDLGALSPGTGEYRIHAAVFGERAANAARWAFEEVPRVGAGQAARWFLGHASADPYVPVSQTTAYAAYLRGVAPPGRIHLRLTPGADHGWAAWNEAIGWARSQGAW
jgi:predicted esterase